MNSLQDVKPKADFEIGGTWGYHISWFDTDQFSDWEDGRRVFKAVGHMPKNLQPSIGDTVVGEFTSTWTIFGVVGVKRESNPPDMFWLDLKPIKQVQKDETNSDAAKEE